MRYWVYINDKVEGPFTDDKLVTLPGFTPDTLICSEDAANSGNQEWVKASSVFEFDQVAPQQEAPVTQQETTPAANNEWASVLLARLDNLTNQLTDLQTKMDGVQSKVDGMQTKLEESIAAQQKAAQEESDRVAALASQMSQLSKPVETPADAALLPETSIPDTIEPDMQSNPTAESDDPNALFEVPGTIDLDPENSTESTDTTNEDDM
ncbi:MAG: hypothetical protein MJ053_05435, partial [Elusimicrobiaceae bacterium]|nr:hypothetical protein [Elusimicrobiaceae bacterium]